jgi:2-oxoisovalerate dehydrogenase E1 component
VANTVSTLASEELDARPVGGRNWITPPDEVEDAFFPFPSDLLDAIHEHLQPLKGYTAKRRTDRGELVRRHREGV